MRDSRPCVITACLMGSTAEVPFCELDTMSMSNFIFEHRYECMIELAADADERAPGGAVTVSLCGQWDHEVLPLAPLFNTRTLAGGLSRLVVDFNAAPQDVELCAPSKPGLRLND